MQTRSVRVIGAPTDYGTNRRGVDMGPSAIRYAGLVEAVEAVGHEVEDVGDVEVPAVGPRATQEDVDLVSRRLRQRVAGCVDEALPLVLGGDHSVAMGSVPGSAGDVRLGVVWFDAHADYNTPSTSPTGNVHGMPLAAVTGYGEFEGEPEHSVRAEDVAVVGLRSVDEAERDNLLDSDVTAYTMSDVDHRGVGAVVEDALDAVCEDVDALHVSLDLDWLDPVEAPGVGTPVRGGVGYREAHLALELVAERACPLRSVDVVEVNPVLDERNRTAELAAGLVASLLGESVL